MSLLSKITLASTSVSSLAAFALTMLKIADRRLASQLGRRGRNDAPAREAAAQSGSPAGDDDDQTVSVERYDAFSSTGVHTIRFVAAILGRTGAAGATWRATPWLCWTLSGCGARMRRRRSRGAARGRLGCRRGLARAALGRARALRRVARGARC